MRRIVPVLALGLLVTAQGGRTLAQEAPRYVLYDLGPGTAGGINDFGQIAVSVVSGKGAASIVTVDDEGNVERTPVSGIAAGDGTIALHAISSKGTVVGVSHQEVRGLKQADADQDGQCDPGEYHQIERACSGGTSATTNLGRLVLHPPPYCTGKDTRVGEYSQASEAWGVNAGGTIVGECWTPRLGIEKRRATVFSGGPKALSQDHGGARAVNKAGKIVGWTRSFDHPSRATLWSGGAQVDIDASDVFFGIAHDISDTDLVVGERTHQGSAYSVGFVSKLDGSSVASSTDLPPLPGGRMSFARAVNDAGVVVGQSEFDVLGTFHAVAWFEGQVQDLNALLDPDSPGLPKEEGAGVVLRTAVDVNANGNVVCTGTRTDASGSSTHAFLLRATSDAILAATPSVADFGSVIVGDKRERTLTIRNGLGTPVKLTVARPAKPFAYAGPAKFAVAPGASFDVKVRMAPPKPPGAPPDPQFAASLVSFRDQDGRTISVPLQGTAVREPPAFLISPSVIDFGKVVYLNHYTVRITNFEPVPVVAKISCSGRPFIAAGTLALGPKATGSFDVACKFDGPRAYAGTLVVTPDIPHRSASIAPIAGEGAQGALVSRAAGDVTVKRLDGTTVAVTVGMELLEGDEVETAVDSEVTLDFPDGSYMTLAEMTGVLMSDLVDSGKRQSVAVQLKMGELSAQVNPKKSFQSDFKVTVPTYQAAPRGTVFGVAYDPETQTGTLRVTEHSVLVTPTNPALKPVVVPAGRQVRVTPDSISELERYPGENSGLLYLAAGAHRAPAGGVEAPLYGNDVVHEGDEISTDAAGAVEVLLTDGTYLRLGESSRMVLKTVKVDLKPHLLEVDLLAGTLDVESSRTVTARVITPTALTEDRVQSVFQVGYDAGTNVTAVRMLVTAGYMGSISTSTTTAPKRVKRKLLPHTQVEVSATAISRPQPYLP